MIAKLFGFKDYLAGGAILLLLAALGWTVHKADHWHDTAVNNASLFHQEHANHLQTITNYQQAAEKARRADEANVARVKREQQVINERTSRDYEARLADARARARRLRAQLEGAGPNPGNPGTAPVSHPGRAPGGADGTPSEDGFSITDRLIATEQAIQLDALQQWVRKNLTLDWSGSSPSSPSASLSPKTKPVPSGRQPTASPISERS